MRLRDIILTVISEGTYSNIGFNVAAAADFIDSEQNVEKQRGKGLFVKSGAPHSILEKERTSFLSSEWPLILQKISRLKLSVAELPSTIKENK